MEHASSEAVTRSKRTLIQGAVVFGLVAICGVVVSVLGSASIESLTNPVFWCSLGLAAVQAFGTAIASYIQKNYEDAK